MSKLTVPFFRPEIDEADIAEVVAVMRSGWLTTGPRVKEFEKKFGEAVGAPHALALNSCTAALHLAVEALGLKAGEAVLVPAMTFAASAEIIRYQGAIPLLVDCDPATQHMDIDDAERKIADLRAGRLPPSIPRDTKIVGVMPVHVGGVMLDVDRVRDLAKKHALWVVEDAAHSFPAAWRKDAASTWERCGENTSHVTCFSFYANKTITTGEGGMATTSDKALADRMRLMALHGLSNDAWDRYSGGKSWDYRIIYPGYKYNMTDVAAALGIHQLARAEAMRQRREAIARQYGEALSQLSWLELPPVDPNRVHAWHLFPLRLRLDQLDVDRNTLIDELRAEGVGTSVHWRPLHLHPYYQETYGWREEHLPAASAVFARLISLPIFSTQRPDEVAHVTAVLQRMGERHAKKR